MKLYEYIEILKLTKTTLKEYENWGEIEIYKLVNKNDNSVTDILQTSKQQFPFSEILNSKKKLDKLKEEVLSCKKCSLGETRLNAVFGTGALDAGLMFVGEGPGYDEDHKGEPFIGRAGQLLTKIIEAMGRTRKNVYIANIVKCHPMIDSADPQKRANDRPPTFEEMKICRFYLDMQLEIIKPKIIVALGASSTKGLLNNKEPISKIRGTVREYNGIKLMPTYHPAALLRNPNLKKLVWEDMKKVMYFLDTGKI
ncbi:MAG: uracil-DNA glycosylase [Endomicrobium sp.]|jgi:DNA polymerase|nr:uracil-DNA glycosylase [Endomicrobium sp.]